MIYFNPKRDIVVRAEASYQDGLSAGLFQKTKQGLQSVHFISRTMTKTEKKSTAKPKKTLWQYDGQKTEPACTCLAHPSLR